MLARYRVRNTTRDVNTSWEIFLAGTSRERRTGLLTATTPVGLWIYPCEAIHTFGMRFPIDVVFLDEENRAVKIYKNLISNRIGFCLRARSVLELPSGVLENDGIQSGDLLLFESVTPESFPQLSVPGYQEALEC